MLNTSWLDLIWLTALWGKCILVMLWALKVRTSECCHVMDPASGGAGQCGYHAVSMHPTVCQGWPTAAFSVNKRERGKTLRMLLFWENNFQIFLCGWIVDSICAWSVGMWIRVRTLTLRVEVRGGPWPPTASLSHRSLKTGSLPEPEVKLVSSEPQQSPHFCIL